MKTIKILHCPSDVGGQAWMLSRAERKLGCESDSMIFYSSRFGYPADYNLDFKKKSPLNNLFKTLTFFFKAIRKYNVFHFYFGRSILPFYLDIPILKIFRKKIFFTFQGCDIRRREYCLEYFEINACRECQILRCQKKYWNLVAFFRFKIAILFANKTFVLNPDLKLISPSSEILPYGNVDLDDWKPIFNQRKRDSIIILHAPTDRNIKGTKYIIEAILKLKKEGYLIELKLIENIQHSQVKNLYLKSDIAIDQLLIGWYGGFAVEMMAVGKPVICYLNKDLFPLVLFAKDIPIINANVAILSDKLKWLIENPMERERIGKEGRKFVEKHHNPIDIAKRLINHYKKS